MTIRLSVEGVVPAGRWILARRAKPSEVLSVNDVVVWVGGVLF